MGVGFISNLRVAMMASKAVFWLVVSKAISVVVVLIAVQDDCASAKVADSVVSTVYFRPPEETHPVNVNEALVHRITN